MNGLQIACLVAAAITGLGAAAALLLPGRREVVTTAPKPVMATAAPEPALAETSAAWRTRRPSSG